MTVKVRKIRGKWGLVVDFHGRRKSRVYGSQERAMEMAERIRSALDVWGVDALKMLEQQARPSRRPTLAEYGKRWIDDLAHRDLRASTRQHYNEHFVGQVLPTFGHVRLDEIDYKLVKAWVIDMSQRYARGTIKFSVSTLRGILQEARTEGLIQSNPVEKMGRWYGAARSRDEVDPFTLQELWQIEDWFASRVPEYYEFVLTLARTGMRIGEARGLKWDDIDWQAGQIHVSRNIPSTSRRDAELPKTPSGKRKIDMSPELQAALTGLLKRRKEEWFGKGKDMPAWVFLCGAGTPVHYSHFINRVWIRAMRKIGIRYRRPHDLRHTYASQLLSQGEDLAYVSRQLGHKNPGITLRVYAHWVPGTRRTGAAGLDRRKALEAVKE